MRKDQTKLPLGSGPGFLLGRAAPAAPTGVGFAATASARPAAKPGALLRDAGEGHVAMFAPTGAGKGRNVLIPTLLSTTDAVVALDVKGELARATARFREHRLDQRVFVLDPWGITGLPTATLNPLDIIEPASPDFVDNAYALAGQLIDQQGPMKEIYWDEGAQSFIAGSIVHVLTRAGDGPRSFEAVWDLAHARDLTYALAQFQALLELSADVTRSCIISVIRQHLRLFGSACVRAATASTSVDLAGLQAGAPVTLYLVVPPDKLRSHRALIRLWLSALLNLLARRTVQPGRKTLFLLDEVAQLGRMEEIVQAVTLMRGYGVRCLLALQSLAQLRQHYRDDHDVLIENAATLITFGHSSYGMSRGMSDLLGDISADALFAMGPDELAIRRNGCRTMIPRRVDYLADALSDERRRPAPPERGAEPGRLG